jgi:hypothetical protein
MSRAHLLVALLPVVAAQTIHYRVVENHFALPDGRKIGSRRSTCPRLS